jgi:hypothetical protein
MIQDVGRGAGTVIERERAPDQPRPERLPRRQPQRRARLRRAPYVADAGANILVQVKRNGAVKVLAFFPVPAGSRSDAVPTCVARGPERRAVRR